VTSHPFVVIACFPERGTRRPGIFDSRTTLEAAETSAARLSERFPLGPGEFIAIPRDEADAWPVEPAA
jgi:hypothetical protein